MAKRKSTKGLLIPAVGYLRRSTGKQEMSLKDQRREIERYADAHAYQIIRWYQDDAISGDATEKRADFQRMRDDASSGDFQAVLCWDQDRFGRFDSLEAGYWIKPFRDAGVTLVTVGEGPINWNDFTGRVMYGLKQEGKHQFLRDFPATRPGGRSLGPNKATFAARPPTTATTACTWMKTASIASASATASNTPNLVTGTPRWCRPTIPRRSRHSSGCLTCTPTRTSAFAPWRTN